MPWSSRAFSVSQSVLPLWKELDYFKEYAAKLRSFLGDDKAEETLSEALYIVSMGTNDFLENYYAVPSGRAAQYAAASEYAGYLLGVAEAFARALHALGARKLDLNGLPPMGCLPLERRAATGACTEEYNAAARGFNAGLRDLVARLDSAGADDGGLGGGARVVYGDVYGAVADVLADPAAHGFEDVGAGCCGTTGRFEMGYMYVQLGEPADVRRRRQVRVLGRHPPHRAPPPLHRRPENEHHALRVPLVKR